MVFSIFIHYEEKNTIKYQQQLFSFMKKKYPILISLISFLILSQSYAQNPIITSSFTADPTARVFNGRLYVYPSGDDHKPEGEDLPGTNGFTMPGYHVFSTEDMTNWVDHGPTINHNNVPWVKPNSYGMWAPDCVERNGKYYFYFPAIPKDESAFRRIGVAIADKPEGPFIAQEEYIAGIKGIDPNVFVDDDGKAYLYFGGGENLFWAELNPDMVSIKGGSNRIQGLPPKYKEGPFMFKKKKKYYFTFPHAPDGSENISYSIGKSPTGPFNFKGKVLERWKNGLWTNHHSFVEFKGQWYVFYHSKEIEGDQHLRSVCVDRIYFNSKGEILESKKTKRGVGKVFAEDQIQIDRYSELTGGVSSRVKDDLVVNWAIFNLDNGSKIDFNDVTFSKKKYSKLKIKLRAKTKNSSIKITYGPDKRLISIVTIPADTNEEWIEATGGVVETPNGAVDLQFEIVGEIDDLAIDWIQFQE